MSDRRYEVYGVRKCDCGCAALPNQHAGSYALLDSAPDALVEEAAKAICEFIDAGLGSKHPDRAFCAFSREMARALLGVLFPGEEEEE